MREKPALMHTACRSAAPGTKFPGRRQRDRRARTLAPGLYLVATPIGNLGDITLRALETLAGADVIACEDTRITRRLTERYRHHRAADGLPRAQRRPGAAARCWRSSRRAPRSRWSSDAGTPLISDPGFKLVREACAAGHSVVALPGASSVLTALAVAGLPTDRFFFEGFLPSKQGARRTRVGRTRARSTPRWCCSNPATAVQDALADLAAALGDREAAICRELTKLHEEVRRAPLAELAAEADAVETRGEFVLVIGPPTADAQAMSAADLDELLREILRQTSVKDAVAQAVELTGRPRREIYARALELSKQSAADGED